MAKFRAKARAVELLGKGQIADLPTAISELWKNGYDAYGDNLQAFLYDPTYKDQQVPYFVLSDDGKGMNKEDILDKWFVLGTDSKSRNELDNRGPDTLNKQPRIKMGEKGIGRLAVAYLGPQMLMLTKKPNYPLEAVFFDWRILENFNLFLEDVNIPNKSIPNVSSVLKVFEDLKKDFLSNFSDTKEQNITWKDQINLRNRIIEDCKSLSLPDFLIEEQILDLLNDQTKSHSTKFIIFQPDQQLLELKNFTKNDENEDLRDNTSVVHTVSSMIALFNLFKEERPEYNTSFWIFNNDGKYDLLNFKSFFSYEDFKHCDHVIEGSFNELGDFSGKVRIYKKKINHYFSPVRKKGKTNYGPFKIMLGYVAGKKVESSVNDELWRVYEEKLNLFGGLYIYRDGFRVLPYGRVDNDFLEFEERRGKHAGEYFFAKRRMFGYIEISRNENHKLIDKSSREGFVNNAAYRDFKSDLIAFFVDLAKKYFATNAQYEYKDEQKKEFKKLAEAEQQEKQREIEARKEFAKQLRTYPQELDHLESNYEVLLKKLESKMNNNVFAYEEVQEILNEIDDCKIKVQQYKLSKPVRYKPTPNQLKNYNAYQKQLNNLTKKITESDNLIKSVQDKLRIHELFKQFEAKRDLYRNTIIYQFAEYQDHLATVINKLGKQLTSEKDSFVDEFDGKARDILPNQNDAKDIKNSIRLLESIFQDTQNRISDRISPFLSHLDRISFEVNEDNLVGFYKIQFEEMKEEWNKTYELAQLGIAVEVIDHQFNTLYSQLSESIKALKENLQTNKEASSRYKTLLNAFEHLEDNYRLLQPLYRTTGRIRKNISGQELFDYVFDFFETRLKDNDIEFKITTAAKEWTVFSFESIFKPVLINIVNNAIYWLQPVNDRKIVMDVSGEKLLIMNSGVPIDDTMLDDIFKLFFSERPKGRGIGLYLAKKSLNGIGFDISASNNPKYNKLKGACFVIENIEAK